MKRPRSPWPRRNPGRWPAPPDSRTVIAADDEGYLSFRGRLKRFLKAGGEMISLPALEEPFQKRYPPDESGPRVAVEGIETPDGRHVVLFTTFDLTIREAAAILLENGFRGVMRLDEVRRIERIPVLGTGKTDYTTLRRLVTEALPA
jgi:long-chain-fatty-acid--[acyl-carrier-protein] ligase